MAMPECLWNIGASLGEGPIWHAADGHLYFVDILGQRICRCSADGSGQRIWPAPRSIGFVLPFAEGDFVAGLHGGLHRFSPATGDFSPWVDVETEQPRNRPNDGHVDAQGRLWFGTMDMDQFQTHGVLYRLHSPGRLSVQDTGYVITNGPATSPDGRVLYHTDTLRQLVYAFDVSDDGELSGKREFLRLSNGLPDGTTVDAEGHLWIAFFGGGRVERYSPQARQSGAVALPCSNVTKLAFGGTDLRTAYVTTARVGLSAEQALAEPLAGGVFTFGVDVPGLPQHAVRL